MTTLLLTHSASFHHETPEGHPERPARMQAVEQALSAPRFNDLVRELAPEGSLDVVTLCHNEHYIDELRHIAPKEGVVYIDGDTSMSPGTWEAVMRGVGGAVAAVDAVMGGKADNAFVATRPPGHHAETAKPMGFCFFDHAAIGARYAQRKYGVGRVAVVDFDVHHGNGTQDIFYADPSVLYCSTHQMPLYPGTGAKDETGVGNIVNAPLRPYTEGHTFREAVASRVLPALQNFRPDLVLVSAGFDAHHRDPLAQLNLVGDDFDWITGRLMEVAGKYASNRLVSVLEGGYDLEGLAESAGLHIARLMKG